MGKNIASILGKHNFSFSIPALPPYTVPPFNTHHTDSKIGHNGVNKELTELIKVTQKIDQLARSSFLVNGTEYHKPPNDAEQSNRYAMHDQDEEKQQNVKKEKYLHSRHDGVKEEENHHPHHEDWQLLYMAVDMSTMTMMNLKIAVRLTHLKRRPTEVSVCPEQVIIHLLPPSIR
ncbi:hypothetical protein [Aneurinibacillus tyrosinisolvens]|uniref:hypothetical protein n=1 Tax=Aneurinibacillus tyrosinisolvens TaxID=1443435 RepID=UPI00063F5A44|nr:hypothetical protein [Aneurinibacillus tyrosinisolvens]